MPVGEFGFPCGAGAGTTVFVAGGVLAGVGGAGAGAGGVASLLCGVGLLGVRLASLVGSAFCPESAGIGMGGGIGPGDGIGFDTGRDTPKA